MAEVDVAPEPMEPSPASSVPMSRPPASLPPSSRVQPRRRSIPAPPRPEVISTDNGPASEPAPESSSPNSERRRLQRLQATFVMLDERKQIYTTEDIGLGGLKYSGPVRPDPDGHRLALVAPNADRAVELLARPVWMERRGAAWTVGARVEGDGGEIRRLQYLFHALADRLQPDEILWTPFALMDQMDPRDVVRRIGEIDPGVTVERVARLCGRVSKRPFYLWQWGHEVLRLLTLSSVPRELVETVLTIKLCAAIFFTTLDDVADEQRDEALLAQVRSLILGERTPPRPDADRRLRVLAAVWGLIARAVEGLPRYRELADCFRFDCATALQSQVYAVMVGRTPAARGEGEERFWLPSTYCMPLFADVDLMCSTSFDLAELGQVRDLVLEAQSMWAIANWLATWEREVRVRDFSSGIFGEVVRRRVLTLDDLDRLSHQEITTKVKGSDVEAYLLSRWCRHRRAMERMLTRFRSVDAAAYLGGVEELFGLQWSSRGLV